MILIFVMHHFNSTAWMQNQTSITILHMMEELLLVAVPAAGVCFCWLLAATGVPLFVTVGRSLALPLLPLLPLLAAVAGCFLFVYMLLVAVVCS